MIVQIISTMIILSYAVWSCLSKKVDDGLMAVCVPAGENEIEFTYHTPGLKVSACVSAAAIAVYGVYLLWIIRKRKSQPRSKR